VVGELKIILVNDQGMEFHWDLDDLDDEDFQFVFDEVDRLVTFLRRNHMYWSKVLGGMMEDAAAHS